MVLDADTAPSPALPAPPDPLPALPAGDDLDALTARAAVYATRAHGTGTRRAYRSAWQSFATWCRSLGRDPLAGDADTVAMYVVRRADDGLAVASIRVALAASRTSAPTSSSSRTWREHLGNPCVIRLAVITAFKHLAGLVPSSHRRVLAGTLLG